MKNDYLKELDYLGLIARLKRLSDNMLYSIRDLYKSEDLDIEPNWHLIFLYLKKHDTRTMTQIAESLRFSQPAVVKMIRRMMERGYIAVSRDNTDNRKKQLRLSQKAIELLPTFEEIWSAGKSSIKEMLDENNKTFLDDVEKLEIQLINKDFKYRILNNLK